MAFLDLLFMSWFGVLDYPLSTVQWFSCHRSDVVGVRENSFGRHFHVVLCVVLRVYFISFSGWVTFFSLFFGVCACSDPRISTYSNLPTQHLDPNPKEISYNSFTQKRNKVQLGIRVCRFSFSFSSH